MWSFALYLLIALLCLAGIFLLLIWTAVEGDDE
jgi:hypothetical protein